MKIRNCLYVLFILLASFVMGSCRKMFHTEPPDNVEGIFSHFWKSFQEDYALFEERKVDWDSMYAVHRPLVHKEMTERELYGVLCDLIDPLEDGHVALMAPQFGLFSANRYYQDRPEDDLFDLSLIQSRYLQSSENEIGSKYLYGKISGKNIGYIHFKEFRQEVVRLEEMLNRYPDAGGYIVDLRHNSGGDVSHSFSFLGRFMRGKNLFLRSCTKNGKGPADFSPWHPSFLRQHGSMINKPLVLLTDRYTVSAAERMVMAARTLPNVRVVGDTTNGTFGTKISRELPNGWLFSYSIQKVEMFDGRSYEGKGLPPDFFVKNSVAEMNQGVDRVLQFAIELLR